MYCFTFKIKPFLCVAILTCLMLGLFSFVHPLNSVETFCSPDGRNLPIYSVETEEKKIALGINCAWDGEDIPDLLKSLEQNQSHATFFLLGLWAEKYPDLAQEIVLSGQEIGSHSQHHWDMNQLTEKEMQEEILASQKSISSACGKVPILFRPPSGAYNEEVIKMIHQQGCIPIQWSIDTLDWKGLSGEEITNRVLEKLSPGEIILLHSGAEHSAEALEKMLPLILEKGFQVVPVGELILPGSSKISASGRQLPKN